MTSGKMSFLMKESPFFIPTSQEEVFKELHFVYAEMMALASLVYDFKSELSRFIDIEVQTMLPQIMREYTMRTTHDQRKLMEVLLLVSPHSKIIRFEDDPDTEIQCGVTIDHAQQNITVVFRGSDSLLDWYTDAQICKRAYKGNSLIHAGFKHLINTKTFQRLARYVRVLMCQHSNYSLRFTGHSLGGVLAVLCSFEVGYMYREKEMLVVTFGCPRIGDETFKHVFEQCTNVTHVRVSNCRDTVTSLPFIGYWHTGTELVLSDSREGCHVSHVDAFNVICFVRCCLAEHLCSVYQHRVIKATQSSLSALTHTTTASSEHGVSSCRQFRQRSF